MLHCVALLPIVYQTKNMLRPIQHVVVLLLTAGFFVSTSAVQAQTGGEQAPQRRRAPMRMQPNQGADIEVSQKEMKTFVKVASEVQKLQQKANTKMQSALEEEGLSMKEYRSMMRRANPRAGAGQQQGRAGSPEPLTEEEKQQLEDARASIMEVQKGMQQKMKTKLDEEGMKPQRFRQIAMALRKDQDLQQRFRKLQQERSGDQDG